MKDILQQYKPLGVSKLTGASLYKHADGHLIAIKKDGYGTKWEHHSADRSISTGSYSGFNDMAKYVAEFHANLSIDKRDKSRQRDVCVSRESRG